MSKNSNKQLHTQLMEWMPSALKSRSKRVKPNNKHKFSKHEAYKQR